MRLIDADALLKQYDKAHIGEPGKARTLIEEAPTVGGWISVKDRLPANDDHVLCCTKSKSGRYNVVIGYYMGNLWRCGMNSNVMHWMPLPYPPMEVEE